MSNLPELSQRDILNQLLQFTNGLIEITPDQLARLQDDLRVINSIYALRFGATLTAEEKARQVITFLANAKVTYPEPMYKFLEQKAMDNFFAANDEVDTYIRARVQQELNLRLNPPPPPIKDATPEEYTNWFGILRKKKDDSVSGTGGGFAAVFILWSLLSCFVLFAMTAAAQSHPEQDKALWLGIGIWVIGLFVFGRLVK